MQQPKLILKQVLRRGLIVFALAGLLSVFSWLSWGIPASQADILSRPSTSLEDLRSPQEREAAYDEAVEISEHPKMGVEKEYEKEVEEYYEEHPEESGIVEKAKEFVTDVTEGAK